MISDKTLEKCEKIANHVITRGMGVIVAGGAGYLLYIGTLSEMVGAGLILVGLFMFAPTRVKKAVNTVKMALPKFR